MTAVQTYEVTDDDIAKGRLNSECHNPVARALRRGGIRRPRVDVFYVFSGGDAAADVVYAVSPALRLWLREWNRLGRDGVWPCTLDVHDVGKPVAVLTLRAQWS